MKRGGFLKRRTPLNKSGKSDTALIKEHIQALVRQVVMKRDGGCILRNVRCGHEIGMEGVVYQADHLITRANSATYADPRLIVCVCKNCHGWKHWHEREYNALIKTILSPEIVELWDKCEQDSWKPTRVTVSDWRKEVAYLQSLL